VVKSLEQEHKAFLPQGEIQKGQRDQTTEQMRLSQLCSKTETSLSSKTETSSQEVVRRKTSEDVSEQEKSSVTGGVTQEGRHRHKGLSFGNVESEPGAQLLSSFTAAKDPASALLTLTIDTSESEADEGVELGDSSQDSCSDVNHEKDTTDFPPVTPPPSEQTRPKLAFSRPQPAAKGKARKLPQIKKQDDGVSDGGERMTVTAAVSKVDSIMQKLQVAAARKAAPPAPPPPAPKPKQKSPRESRHTFMTRRELMGKPSKLLSDSGVTVITKAGSTPSATDVKYLVTKPQDSKPLAATLPTPATSSLMAFDALLDSDSKASSSGFPSSPSKGDSPATDSPLSDETKDRSGLAESSQVRPPSPSRIPTRTFQLSTKPPSAGAGKSSSVKDFLASFSSLQGKDDSKKTKEDSKKSLNPLTKSSSFTSFDVGKEEERVERRKGPRKSLSVDSFQALLDETFNADTSNGEEDSDILAQFEDPPSTSDLESDNPLSFSADPHSASLETSSTLSKTRSRSEEVPRSVDSMSSSTSDGYSHSGWNRSALSSGQSRSSSTGSLRRSVEVGHAHVFVSGTPFIAKH
jgi:hypothetical protein